MKRGAEGFADAALVVKSNDMRPRLLRAQRAMAEEAAMVAGETQNEERLGNKLEASLS